MKGAPKGNQFAKGNSGGGRLSAYEEQKEAIWLKEKWEKETAKLILEAKIKSGTYSIRDMFLYKALEGNERLLNICANKIIPDLLQLQGPGGQPLEVGTNALLPEMAALRAKYEAELKKISKL